jgi:hypothetical protein
MSFAGGFALEDSIFKGLALGAPFTKLICMGRGIMIPGFVGSNIEGALFEEKRAKSTATGTNCPKRSCRWVHLPRRFSHVTLT